MKKIKIIWATCGLFLYFQSTAISQDSITISVMEPYSYDFTVNNGQFQGSGAKVLQDAISEADITMLGNTVQSEMDAQFSLALLNSLNSNGYNKMAIEEGWVSGKIINALAKKPKIIQQFADLNGKYAFRKEGHVRTPIPSLKSVDGSKFIQDAIEKDWTIFAIGLEDWAGYGMVVDELYSSIPIEAQSKYKELYSRTKEVLDNGYRVFGELNNDGALKFMNTLHSSTPFTTFIEKMGTYESNHETIYHFKKSLAYWTAYGNRNYFKKNVLSIEETKKRMASLLIADGFDFSEDKLLVKMFIGHLAKGITGNGFYGVGNMLHELTEYQGNTSLSIGFIPRYFERDGVVEDYLESDLYYLQIFKEFIPLGKKDNWVLIDLRPFNEKLFYGPYVMSPFVRRVIARYDILIIPKTDSEPTGNY